MPRCPTSKGLGISKRENRKRGVKERGFPAQLRHILLRPPRYPFKTTKNKEKIPKISGEEKTKTGCIKG